MLWENVGLITGKTMDAGAGHSFSKIREDRHDEEGVGLGSMQHNAGRELRGDPNFLLVDGTGSLLFIPRISSPPFAFFAQSPFVRLVAGTKGARALSFPIRLDPYPPGAGPSSLSPINTDAPLPNAVASRAIKHPRMSRINFMTTGHLFIGLRSTFGPPFNRDLPIFMLLLVRQYSCQSHVIQMRKKMCRWRRATREWQGKGGEWLLAYASRTIGERSTEKERDRIASG